MTPAASTRVGRRHGPRPGPRTRPRARLPQGLLLPAVVWVIVALGGIVATLATLSVRAGAGVAQEVLGARALAAARAGTEWGAWLTRDPQGTIAPGPGILPDCFATATALALPAPLDAFTVQVSCTRYPTSGTLDEGGLKLAVYQIVATASNGATNDAGRVERRVQLRIETCKNPGGVAPTYSC